MIIIHCGREASVDVIGEAVELLQARTNQPIRVSSSDAELTELLSQSSLLTQSSTQASPVVIVPATTGRDVHSVTAIGQAAAWALKNSPNLPICVSAPLGDATKTVAACRSNMRKHPADHYVVVSTALDPFSDAELFRLARLAWQYGSAEVSVAFDGAHPSVAEAVSRAAQLGASAITVLRADLHACSHDNQVPLWSPAALSVLIERTADQALHTFTHHGDDGIATACLADHDHGYAHSHEHDHSHGHEHTHGHSHGHPHSHSHGHGHEHSHAHSHGHEHSNSHPHTHTHSHPHTHTHNGGSHVH